MTCCPRSHSLLKAQLKSKTHSPQRLSQCCQPVLVAKHNRHALTDGPRDYSEATARPSQHVPGGARVLLTEPAYVARRLETPIEIATYWTLELDILFERGPGFRHSSPRWGETQVVFKTPHVKDICLSWRALPNMGTPPSSFLSSARTGVRGRVALHGEALRGESPSHLSIRRCDNPEGPNPPGEGPALTTKSGAIPHWTPLRKVCGFE